jgi:hypothetical protein
MMTFRAISRIPKSRGFALKCRATSESVESGPRLLDPVPTHPRHSGPTRESLENEVEPRGFEPLTSAVQKPGSTF